ncbi:hypothetical protein FQZ97_999330 [compost metagenome]
MGTLVEPTDRLFSQLGRPSNRLPRPTPNAMARKIQTVRYRSRKARRLLLIVMSPLSEGADQGEFGFQLFGTDSLERERQESPHPGFDPFQRGLERGIDSCPLSPGCGCSGDEQPPSFDYRR